MSDSKFNQSKLLNLFLKGIYFISVYISEHKIQISDTERHR